LAGGQVLVRAALDKMRPRWARLAREGSPEAHVRRVMLLTFLTWGWRGGLAFAAQRGRPGQPDTAAGPGAGQAVSEALRILPRKQRAAVVLLLQFFDDLTETQTADALGCSVGTVQSLRRGAR
jgi:DNA-directed RNA polymerase specialized sigma24 family protein